MVIIIGVTTTAIVIIAISCVILVVVAVWCAVRMPKKIAAKQLMLSNAMAVQQEHGSPAQGRYLESGPQAVSDKKRPSYCYISDVSRPSLYCMHMCRRKASENLKASDSKRWLYTLYGTYISFDLLLVLARGSVYTFGNPHFL